MTNVKFNSRPFEGTLNSLVDNLFTELPVLFRQNFDETVTKGSVPVNVKESEKGYEMEFVAPGFSKEDFKVSVERNLLTVSTERKDENKQKKKKQIRREYSYRSFKRTFTLDEKIDATNISASYINGVLILNLPRKAEVKASATEIKIN